MDGLLLVDKPSGWTSFDVVNKVRRTVEASGSNTSKRKRFPVGHTGTLDPMATGLLVLLLGSYTKRAPTLTKLDKVYEVTMRLGVTSSTGDEEGQKASHSDYQPTIAEVTTAIERFTGRLLQTPPAFSAIKVNGKRAYALAREGKKPILEPRPVEVYSLTLTDYEYPYIRYTAHVSSGTYIRSLVEDMGEALGSGAYMSALRRTAVGDYSIDGALSVEGIGDAAIRQNLQA